MRTIFKLLKPENSKSFDGGLLFLKSLFPYGYGNYKKVYLLTGSETIKNSSYSHCTRFVLKTDNLEIVTETFFFN